MADPFEQHPRPDTSPAMRRVEAFLGLFPNLSVTRDYVGQINITTERLPLTTVSDISVYTSSLMSHPTRPAIGLSAQSVLGPGTAVATLLCDNPDEIHFNVSGSPGIDPPEIIQMAHGGMAVFDAYMRMTSEERRTVDRLGRRVWDFLAPPEEAMAELRHRGVDVKGTHEVIAMDVYPLWRAVFPQQ